MNSIKVLMLSGLSKVAEPKSHVASPIAGAVVGGGVGVGMGHLASKYFDSVHGTNRSSTLPMIVGGLTGAAAGAAMGHVRAGHQKFKDLTGYDQESFDQLSARQRLAILRHLK